MRFIIKEQSFEQVIAAGEYRYERDGRPTGAVEKWRRTAVTDGYQFVRVDLDARAAPSGHSYLYHAVVNPAGAVERLKYRFWGAGLDVVGDVVLMATAVTATRTVNGQDSEQVFDLPPGYRFWFPSVVGLHFVGRGANGVATAVTLNGQVGGPDTLAVQVVEFTYHMLITDTMEKEIAGQVRQYVPHKLAWNDQIRIIWRSYDASGWPLGMVKVGAAYQEELTAVVTRHTQYKT